MSVRNDFKKATLAHTVASFPDDFPLCMPSHPTKDFIGLKEWGQVFIQHATGRQHSHGGVGHRRYKRTGSIIVRCSLERFKGDKRSDELASIFENAFDGKNVAGIDSVFKNARCREAGQDDDGRYNILLCEALFEYREIK